MNTFDWIGLTLMLATLFGAQLSQGDPHVELQAPTAEQAAGTAASSVAGLAIGGELVMQFADSGTVSAHERAIAARQNLRRAIEHYHLPDRYVGLGLRLGGNDQVAQILYFDLPITTVTTADAQAARAGSARALAERWRQALDAELKQLPKPLPDTWLATTGEVAGLTRVSDSLLARTVAGVLTGRDSRGVRVATSGGRVTLEGTVADEAARARVVALVREVPGVVKVVDRLAVSL